MALKREHWLLILLGVTTALFAVWSYNSSRSRKDGRRFVVDLQEFPENDQQEAPDRQPPIFFDEAYADVLTAVEADEIPNREYVIGVHINDESKAYPMSSMRTELGNDVVGGEPIAISW